MVTFEKTDNVEIIREILTKSKLAYAQMVNDMAPPRHQFRVRIPDSVFPIVVKERGSVLGLVLIDAQPSGSAKIHFCLLPRTWGKSDRIGKAFLTWVWANTSLIALQAPVPQYNRLAKRFAVSLGFRQYGIEENSVRKHGKLFGIDWMKLERPNATV